MLYYNCNFRLFYIQFLKNLSYLPLVYLILKRTDLKHMRRAKAKCCKCYIFNFPEEKIYFLEKYRFKSWTKNYRNKIKDTSSLCKIFN